MDHPIAFPTYEEHIRDLFTGQDIGCMATVLDLATYEGVMDKASRILSRVKQGTMPPPDENRRWSAEKVQTFENWIDNGYQRVPAYLVERSPDARLRKDIHALKTDELKLLKQAFAGLRRRDADPNDRFSLFNLAGIHWYPGPRHYIHCRHHDHEYNPWHRAYLIVFENALRSIEGCENVTLPYWDIVGEELPTWMFEEPFYPYLYPHDLMDYTGETVSRKTDDPIHRYSAKKIHSNVFDRLSPIPDSITHALSTLTWEKFNGWSGNVSLHDAIIEAHDNGHGDCGLTLSNPATAAFDPLFWFFHCNWDRLWWQWQTSREAVSLDQFKSKLEQSADWLDDQPANILKPFDVTSANMIDLSDWNIDYAPPKSPAALVVDDLALASGRVSSTKSFSIVAPDTLSLRVKDLNRLTIRGSFRIDLLVNGTRIRSTRIFQPDEVSECETCLKQGIFSKDFRVRAEEIPKGAEISLEIWRFLDDGTTEQVDLETVGNPSVNIRYLLEQV